MREKMSGAVESARPYVERVARDEELHEHVKKAYESARRIYDELIGDRGATGVAFRVARDKDLQKDLRRAVDELREAGRPFISVLVHPTTGGVAASFAALGDVILAEPGALLSFSGPRVVKQTTRESLPDDFGLAESNFRHGHVDLVVPRPELRDTVARAVALLSGGSPYRPPALVGEIDPVGAIGRMLSSMRRRVAQGNPFRNGGPDVDD